MLRKSAVLVVFIFVTSLVYPTTGLAGEGERGYREHEKEPETREESNWGDWFKSDHEKFGRHRKMKRGHGGMSRKQACMSGRGKRMKYLVEKAEAELELSEQESERLQELSYSHREQMIEQWADVRKKQLDLQRSLDEFSPDEESVMTAVEALYSAREKLRKAKLKHRLKVQEILGEERWEKLRESVRRPWDLKEDGDEDFWEETDDDTDRKK